MKKNLRLSQKVLMLIAVPLAFELLFVGVLIFSLGQLEVEHSRSEKTRAASMFFNVELQAMVEAMGAMVLFNVLHEPKYLKQFQHSVDTLHMQNEHLRVLAGTEMAPDVQALKAVSEEAVSSISDIEKLSKSDDRIDMMRGFIKVQRLLNKANTLGSRFITRETVMNEQLQAKQAQARELVKVVIIFGVGFSILLSVILVLYFNSGAAKQLVAIDDNMLRLAAQKPLKEPLPGNDELARIDQTLFRLSNDLRQMKEQQQEVYAMITHDLRSPLSSMKIVFDLLQIGALGELNERGKDRIKSSDYLLNRLVALTNDLLDVEKFESGNLDLLLESVSVDKLFNDSANVASVKAESKKIKLRVEPTELKLVCDQERIGRVLVNLLDNAIKFSKADDVITLSATNLGEQTKIFVQDTGRGIPKDKIGRIFERFSQTDRADETIQKGSGRGLAICKAIVEAHGGTIGVDSVLDKGSTFWFTMPNAVG